MAKSLTIKIKPFDMNQKQIREIREQGFRVREEEDLVIIQDPSTHEILLGAMKEQFGLLFHWATEKGLEVLEKLMSLHIV